MITRVPIHQHERQRPPRRESEKDLLLRLAKEHRREERRARRSETFRRLTGRARPASQ